MLLLQGPHWVICVWLLMVGERRMSESSGKETEASYCHTDSSCSGKEETEWTVTENEPIERGDVEG